jgi:hypothetical protein
MMMMTTATTTMMMMTTTAATATVTTNAAVTSGFPCENQLKPRFGIILQFSSCPRTVVC